MTNPKEKSWTKLVSTAGLLFAVAAAIASWQSRNQSPDETEDAHLVAAVKAACGTPPLQGIDVEVIDSQGPGRMTVQTSLTVTETIERAGMDLTEQGVIVRINAHDGSASYEQILSLEGLNRREVWNPLLRVGDSILIYRRPLAETNQIVICGQGPLRPGMYSATQFPDAVSALFGAGCDLQTLSQRWLVIRRKTGNLCVKIESLGASEKIPLLPGDILELLGPGRSPALASTATATATATATSTSAPVRPPTAP